MRHHDFMGKLVEPGDTVAFAPAHRCLLRMAVVLQPTKPHQKMLRLSVPTESGLPTLRHARDVIVVIKC